jgi:hypothetical protein
MSVRKRKWTTRKGETKEAWVVSYTGQSGSRHLETFDRKKDADAYHAPSGSTLSWSPPTIYLGTGACNS